MRVILYVALLRGAWDALTNLHRKPIIDTNRRVLAWAWGDGHHDDSANLERAFRRAAEAHLPRGTFVQTRTLDPGKVRRLVGAGVYESALRYGAVDD